MSVNPSPISDTTDISDWQANLAAQGVSEANLLARVAVDLGLGAEVIDADDNAQAALILLLGQQLLDRDRETIDFSADARGRAIRTGVTRLIAYFGQAYPYKRGASSMSAVARIHVMNTSTKYAWFTAAETAGWASPAYVVTLAGDFQTTFGSPAPAVGDLITIAGQDYTVRKIDKPQVGAITVKTTLFVSR